VRRRDFIKFIGPAAVLWPLRGLAQQSERVRRVAVLMNLAPEDQLAQRRLETFVRTLSELGWINGRNVQIETCWAAGVTTRFRRCAAELVALAPDVILAASGATVGPLLEVTRTIPIVFAQTPDPVGAGYVASLAHPGGNATGFTQFDFGIGGKWLELLRQVDPAVTRVLVLRDHLDASGVGQFGAIQSAAQAIRVEASPVRIRDIEEIEHTLDVFARSSNGGLIVTASTVSVHRDLIVALAARYKMPAVYPARFFASSGGLMSYGPNTTEPYVRAAEYVDRILKGEKPADLPVQAPTRYELVINLKTARMLGLTVPPPLLAIADEVIE
jgi:ABC-type uncharacterized transport system substrate-binding protein